MTGHHPAITQWADKMKTTAFALFLTAATSCCLQAATIAQFDWSNLSSDTSATITSQANTTVSTFDSTTSLEWGITNTNGGSNDSTTWRSGSLGATNTDHLIGFFTVTADTPGSLNLERFSYDWWGNGVSGSASRIFTSKVEIVTNGSGAPDPLFESTAQISALGVAAFGTNIIDLTASAYQGLDSVTISIYGRINSSTGTEYMGLLGSQSSGSLPGGGGSVTSGTYGDMTLTGTVAIPEPSAMTLIGLAGVALLLRRRRRS